MFIKRKGLLQIKDLSNKRQYVKKADMHAVTMLMFIFDETMN